MKESLDKLLGMVENEVKWEQVFGIKKNSKKLIDGYTNGEKHCTQIWICRTAPTQCNIEIWLKALKYLDLGIWTLTSQLRSILY